MNMEANMEANTEKKKRLEALAGDIMLLSRNTLLVNLRFLDLALSRLELAPVEGGSICTDGKRIYYSPDFVLRSYKAEREAVARAYLHMVMHCVFRHMFVDPRTDRKLWNLACDIAAESLISELHLKALSIGREAEQIAAAEALRQELGLISAEKTYAWLKQGRIGKEGLEELCRLFAVDEHSGWYPPEEPQRPQAEEEEDREDGSPMEQEASQEREEELPRIAASEDLENVWREIAEKLQTDLETFSKEQGDRAGELMQSLSELNRDRVDYAAFLRKFAAPGEVMRINDDEFDHIFYTYGLQLYRNVPLVEPLEYKEVRRIREFVIALDTSGSTSGRLVQKFVEKTYNILKSTESFFSGVNLHVIQCDADIQEHVKISCQEELDAYLKTMQLRGQGGTDFRPVFRLVDRLIQEKEFHSLKGLLYFTDGCGSFPEQMPPYKTAFVFLSDSYFNPQVPSWAIRLVVQKDEISEMKE